MKFKKQQLILKEAIKQPENLNPGDVIAIKLNKGAITKFEVVSTTSDSVILSSGDVKYKIPLNALTKDNSNLPFIKLQDGKTTKGSVDVLNISQVSKSPDKINKITPSSLNIGDVVTFKTKEKGDLVYRINGITDDLLELDSDKFDETHYISVDSDISDGSKITINTPTTNFDVTIESLNTVEGSKLDVNAIEEGDFLRIITKDGKIFKLSVSDVADDYISVEAKGNIMFIRKTSLNNYDEKGFIIYRPDDSDTEKKLTVKKIEHLPNNEPESLETDVDSDDDNDLIDYERIDRLIQELLTLNGGDKIILPILNKDNKEVGEIEFDVLFADTNQLNLDYISNKGFGAKLDALHNWDDIFLRTHKLEPIEGEERMTVVLDVQRGSKEKSYNIPGVGNIRTERTSGKKPKKIGAPDSTADEEEGGLGVEFITGFYDTLKDMDGESMLKLSLEDSEKKGTIHLEPADGFYDGEKFVVKVFDRKGNIKPFYSDLEALIDSDSLLMTNSSFVIDGDTEVGQLTLINQDGKRIAINFIVDYEIDNRSRDEIEDMINLDDETKLSELFNNQTFQDTIIKRPNWFAKLFGAKNLGWIASINRYNEEKYGENYDKLKRGNSVYFKFLDKAETPYRVGQTLKGKMIEKDEIKIRSVVNKATYVTIIKILSGADGEDRYNAEVQTDIINNNVVKSNDKYRSVISIKEYNV